MSDTTAGLLQVAMLLGALALCYRPLGAYMAGVYTSDRHSRMERGIYRVVGVDPSHSGVTRIESMGTRASAVANRRTWIVQGPVTRVASPGLRADAAS